MIKKTVALLIFIKSLCSYALSPEQLNRLTSMNEVNLKKEITTILKKGHKQVGYNNAKRIIFEKIDNEKGQVCCVYSLNYCLKTKEVPSHKVMNVEHTWPQSLGAVGIAKSDLYHLFPTNSVSNSKRSSLPFCEVEKVKWDEDGSIAGESAYDEKCFEPPENHKGNLARAMFYFSLRYQYPIDKHQEDFLRKWHKDDPVDFHELSRANEIEDHQGNRNIFIDHPELVDLISDF